MSALHFVSKQAQTLFIVLQPPSPVVWLRAISYCLSSCAPQPLSPTELTHAQSLVPRSSPYNLRRRPRLPANGPAVTSIVPRLVLQCRSDAQHPVSHIIPMTHLQRIFPRLVSGTDAPPRVALQPTQKGRCHRIVWRSAPLWHPACESFRPRALHIAFRPSEFALCSPAGFPLTSCCTPRPS